MRCRINDLVDSDDQYRTVKGTIVDDGEQMMLEVYDDTEEPHLAMKLFRDGANKTGIIAGQPQIRRTVSSYGLSISSRQPELPTTDTELEAFARYILQAPTEDLTYTGPKQLSQ